MKDNLNRKFKIKDLLALLLTAAFPVICVSGVSPVPYALKSVLIYAVGILSVLTFVFGGIKLRLNAVNISAFLLVAFTAIQIFYSLDRESTLSLTVVYACAFTVLFLDMPADKLQLTINIMYVFCMVIAFSIILSLFIDNCMLGMFSFVVNPFGSDDIASAIKTELASGAYSGFAREKGEAAYIMNVGIAVVFSKYFSCGKLGKKDIFCLAVLIFALVLTSKRMMFVIPIVCFVLFMFISKLKGKVFRFACVLMIAVFAAVFALMYIPEFADLLNRFLDEENVESVGNRDVLWEYLNMMIASYWKFGCGFGSYNQYAYNKGLRVYGEKWTYNGHNSYLQCFGELGVIGSLFFAAMIISALLLTYRLIKNSGENKKILRIALFSMYIQLMTLIYAVTGNPAYVKQIIFIYAFAVGAALCLDRQTSKACGKFGRYKALQSRRGLINER